MKTILGLDLGTNSIGWALINKEEEKIIDLGSRIVPMGDDKGNFEAGKKVTRNATRRIARGIRRGNHRYKLRRNKLVYALHKLGMLPDIIGFGYFQESEKILNKFPNAMKLQKVFIAPIRKGQKHNADVNQLLNLRERALREKVSLKELGRIFYLLNQRRGYNGGGDENEKETTTLEGETQKEKKIYKKVNVVSFKPIQGNEIVGKGKTEKKYPSYHIKLKIKNSNNVYEGRAIRNCKAGEELEVTLLRQSKESKSNFFQFETDALKREMGYTENFTAIVEQCNPTQEYYKKKWAYEISIKDSDDNEDERVNNGKLYLRNTKQAEQIKEGEVFEFEINIKAKENSKEFEYFIPIQTNWQKNLDAIEKTIIKKQKLTMDAGDLDANGNGNYHICHYFIDKFNEKANDGRDLKVRDNVILRKRYIAEFDAIWERQMQPGINDEFRALVENTALLDEIINYIFPERDKSKPETEQSFQSKRAEFIAAAKEKGLKYLIKEQIVYYQRKLKSQSDLIGTCQYEIGDSKKGLKPEKVLERSHPIFQEFRIWDKINNLYVEKRNPEGNKYKYSKRFLSNEEKSKVYEALNNAKELSYDGLEKCLDLQVNREYKRSNKNEFENLKPEQRYKFVDFIKGLHRKEKLKGNETKVIIKKLLGGPLFDKLFATDFNHYEDAIYNECYNLLYKIDFDGVIANEMDIEDQRVQGIRAFYKKHISPADIPGEQDYESYLDKRAMDTAAFKFPRKYASLSEKAISNLLQYMQPLADGWHYPEKHMERLQKVAQLHEQYKTDYRTYTDKEENETKISKTLIRDFYIEYADVLYKGGLPYFAAAGLYYGRHTAQEQSRIKDYHDIQPLGKEETLRNPVVEQMVNETLQTIKSILKEYKIKPDELEIRVELARELKNNAEERAGMHDAMLRNARMNKFAAFEIMQMEYEEKKDKKVSPKDYYKCKGEGCSINSQCYKSSKLKHPSANQILKYKLWKEQGFVSPYTGQPIPLCNLFNGDQYNKEHIIPKQRFFDDSNANIVMAENDVNKAKDNLTALEFIKQYGGKEIKGHKILTLSDFENHVRDSFHGRKQKNLLIDKIPEDFVERQKKETQYIARKIKEKLSSIVGLDNVTTTTGGITDHLRELWGLNRIFKEMNKERYEHMAVMVEEPKDSWVYFKETEMGKKNLVLKNWSKRYDHRHHAIDALVIACTGQNHITQINTLNQIVQTKLKEQFTLVHDNGAEYTEVEISDKLSSLSKEEKEKFQQAIGKLRDFKAPWKNFQADAKEKIEQSIVSFKSKRRILIQNKEDKTTGKRLDELMLKVRGALHLAKVYGTKKIERFKNVKLEEAFNSPELIVNEIVKNDLIARKQLYVDYKIFKAKLKESPIIYFDGEKECKISNAQSSIKISDGIGDVNTKTISLLEIGEAETPISLIEKIIPKSLSFEIENHYRIDNNSNKSDAFSQDGIDELNEKRRIKRIKPIFKVLISFAKNADDISLKPIVHKFSFKQNKENGEAYYETKDNYCYAILQKNNERDFKPITFFDAVQWVTNRFRNDLKSNFKFPRKYNERLEYIENIIRERIAENNPGWEIEHLLQQDDLIYHPIDQADAEQAKQNPNNSFWFDKEKKRWKRIYRAVKFTGNRSFYVNHNIASPINYKPILDEEETKLRERNDDEIPKDGLFEFSDKNCSQFEVTEEYIIQALKSNNRKYKSNKIQDTCIKIEVDRLGNIKPYTQNNSYTSTSTNATTANDPAPLYSPKVTIGTYQQADDSMLMHTANMSHEERLAYLQKLREITHDSNISDEEKKMNFKKININPPHENS